MAQPPLLTTWYAARRFAVLLLCGDVSSCPEPHALVLAVQRNRTEQQIPHVLRSMLFPAVKLMCWTDSPYYMSAQDIRDLPRDMFADLYTVSALPNQGNHMHLIVNKYAAAVAAAADFRMQDSHAHGSIRCMQFSALQRLANCSNQSSTVLYYAVSSCQA